MSAKRAGMILAIMKKKKGKMDDENEKLDPEFEPKGLDSKAMELSEMIKAIREKAKSKNMAEGGMVEEDKDYDHEDFLSSDGETDEFDDLTYPDMDEKEADDPMSKRKARMQMIMARMGK